VAKSVKEKLSDFLKKAIELRDGAVVGDQEGQYPQAAVDALNFGIEFVTPVSEEEDATDEAVNEAIGVIMDAIKSFKASVIKPEPPKEPEKVSIKGVVLKGWGNRKGTHSIHLKNRIISFVDGKANVSVELADELKKAGYVE